MYLVNTVVGLLLELVCFLWLLCLIVTLGCFVGLLLAVIVWVCDLFGLFACVCALLVDVV